MAQLMVTSQLILPADKLRSVKWISLQNKIDSNVGYNIYKTSTYCKIVARSKNLEMNQKGSRS